MTYQVVALYRFTPVADVAGVCTALREQLAMEYPDLCGSLLIAPEGINGTLAGSAATIDALLKILHDQFGLTPGEDHVKFSHAPEKPFARLKIRPKKEIITFKQPAADPNVRPGRYVAAHDWNALLDDPNVLVLDTRNTYESMIGTFRDAVTPPIEVFTEFADFVRENLAEQKHKKVAMFCTGGIRCEKASAFMLSEGFENVYHLHGGILKYLEDVPAAQSRWQGDCYVFDKRMAVGHGLQTGNHVMCFACGFALDEGERQHAQYEAGVSCRHCYDETSGDSKARFRERQKQMTAEA